MSILNTSRGLLRRRISQCDWWSAFYVCGIGAYILFVPTFSIIPSLGPYNQKRVLQISLLIAVGGVLLAKRPARRRGLGVFQSLPRVTRLGLLTVFGLGIFSSALAPAPFYAFLEVGHFVLLFTVAVGVASVVRETSKWVGYGLLAIATTSAILYSVHFVVGYGMHLTMADIERWPSSATNFANIRFFNHYQTWTLPLLVGSVLAVPRQWRTVQMLLFAISSLWWALAFASGGQGTMVAATGATVCVGFLFWKRVGKWLALQGATAVVGWALFKLMFSLEVGSSAPAGSPFGEQLSGDSRYGRLDHWSICLDLAWAHPWLGAGPMHYAWPPFNFEPAASPHSAFMQWVGEWGIPSTAIMTSLTAWGGWTWIQQERQDAETASLQSNAIRISLVASVLAGGAHAMVSGLLVTSLSQVLLVLVVGWAWGRYRPSGRRSFAFPYWSEAVFCAIIVGGVSVVGASLQDLSTIKERRLAFREAVDRGYYSPRYWTQGYIGVRDSSVIKQARRE